MNIYFDCEFTGLHQDTTLISIGLISESGQEFYAEFTDYDKEQVDEWIQKNVIEKLLFNDTFSNWQDKDSTKLVMRSDKETIRWCLTEWLAKFETVQFISDVCHYDFVLLIDLLSGNALALPDSISSACHDINQDIADYLRITDRAAFGINRERFANYKGDVQKHNALYDARIIACCYAKICACNNAVYTSFEDYEEM